MCVLTHTKFQQVEFCLPVFHRNITILNLNFFSYQNRNSWLAINILITYKYFLIFAAKLAKIFLKLRKKSTLSNVLNFTSLFDYFIIFFYWRIIVQCHHQLSYNLLHNPFKQFFSRHVRLFEFERDGRS